MTPEQLNELPSASTFSLCIVGDKDKDRNYAVCIVLDDSIKVLIPLSKILSMIAESTEFLSEGLGCESVSK